MQKRLHLQRLTFRTRKIALHERAMAELRTIDKRLLTLHTLQPWLCSAHRFCLCFNGHGADVAPGHVRRRGREHVLTLGDEERALVIPMVAGRPHAAGLGELLRAVGALKCDGAGGVARFR
jgi:hypothetical protein